MKAIGYSLIFSILTLFFVSCGKTTYTVLVQNTHQYWDTLDFCMIISINDKIDPFTAGLKLDAGDSVIWNTKILRSDTNTMYAKTFDISKFKHFEPYFIKTTIDVNGERLDTNTDTPDNLTKYTIVTVKNKGVANDLLRFSTDKDKSFKDKKIVKSE